MRRVAVDLAPLRASHDLRLLLLGEFLTGLGTQAALVALPFQLYTQTGSAFLTGLLGAVELVPMITAGLWGGAIADRMDRRRLLLVGADRARGLRRVAGGGRAVGRAAGLAALRPRRPAGGLRLRRGRHADGDRPEPRRAGAPARRARAGLRPRHAHRGDRPGRRRPADRGRRRGGRVPGGRRELPGHGRGRLAHGPAARRTASTSTRRRSGARSPRGCASCAATRRSRARSSSTCSP